MITYYRILGTSEDSIIAIDWDKKIYKYFNWIGNKDQTEWAPIQTKATEKALLEHCEVISEEEAFLRIL